MSMNGCLRSVSLAVVKALQKDSGLTDVIAVTDWEAVSLPPEMLARLPEPKRREWERWQERLRGTGAILAAAGITGEMLDPPLQIHDTWGAIHYVLSGSAHQVTPAPGNAIMGGAEVGADRGYGRVRWLPAAEVARVAKALSAISDAEFLRRFDPKVLRANDVYHFQNWEEKDDEISDRVIEAFGVVRSYYGQARARKRCMLLFIE